MARRVRSYSRLTEEALLLLGKQIKLARISRRRSETELASRVGIARSTLQKIEQGDPGVEIGLASSSINALALRAQPVYIRPQLCKFLRLTSPVLA